MNAEFHQWTPEPLPASVRAALERLANTESVRHIAVMPDVHLARDVCVGTVVATEQLLLPQAVGGDIGCGMAVLAFDANADALDHESVAGRILANLYEQVPIVRRTRRSTVELPEALCQSALSDPRLDSIKRRDGMLQLGTLGSGNHFLELQADDEGRLWLMVHSGSRGMGQTISALHLQRAGRTRTGLVGLDPAQPAGQAYWHDLQWALAYAAANRRAMIDRAAEVVRRVVGVAPLDETYLDCPHNYVRQEEHAGRALLVHRKGAMSAEAGEPGVIPGSMGTWSFHVRGRGFEPALRSSSHGAGRRLDRSEARRRISTRDLENQMKGVWFDRCLARRLREESPEAYKDIEAVMRAQKELTRIVRRLRPLLCYKGS